MEEEKGKSKTQVKDYYQILGVKNDATPDAIETAYFELLAKYGPNSSGENGAGSGASHAFQEITEAYATLIDPSKRQGYDRTLNQARQAASTNSMRASFTKLPAYGGAPRASWTKLPAFNWGNKDNDGNTLQQMQVQAFATEMQADITLKEAIKGTKRYFDLVDLMPCEACINLKPVNRMQCPNCRGVGHFSTERQEEIDMPAGLYDEQELRFPELGRFDLRANKKGDLVIKIKIKEHAFLSVSGKDVLCKVPVTLYEAILGADIEVPTATGKATMKIQPLTQNGRVYRLKGLGLSGGDELVTVEVLIPQKLTSDEVVMFRKLKELSREPNPRDSYAGS